MVQNLDFLEQPGEISNMPSVSPTHESMHSKQREPFYVDFVCNEQVSHDYTFIQLQKNRTIYSIVLERLLQLWKVYTCKPARHTVTGVVQQVPPRF